MKKMNFLKIFILSISLVFMISNSTYATTTAVTYPQIAVEEGEWIYYLDDTEYGAVYKTDLTLKNTVKIADLDTNGIIVKDNWIYYLENPYSNEGNTKICRVMTDGSNKEVLRKSENFRGLELLTYYNDKLHFVANFKLNKMSLDGSDETYVCDYSDHTPYQINGRYLYSLKYDGNINKVDIFTNEKDIIEYDFNVESFVVNNGLIYGATEYHREIDLFKQDVKTRTITNISSEYNSFDNLFIQDDYLYTQAYSPVNKKGAILKMSLKDNTMEKLSDNRFYDFTIAGEHLFFRSENRMVALDTIKKKSRLLSEEEITDKIAVVMPNQGVYYSSKDGIFLVTLDGSKSQVTDKEARYLKVYEHYLIYKSKYDATGICVYNTQSNVETYIEGSEDYWPLDIENNLLYIGDSGSVNKDDAYLYTLPLDAKDMSKIKKITPFLLYGKVKNGILYKEWFAGYNAYSALLSVDLNTDSQKDLFKIDLLDYEITDNAIYYIGSRLSSRGIYARSLNGSNKRTLYTAKAPSNPGFFEVYGDYLYFEERNRENMHYSIKRINLKNSQSEHLFTDSADFLGMLDHYLIYQPHKRYCTLPIKADDTHKIKLLEELKYLPE